MKSLTESLSRRNFNRSGNIRQIARTLGLYPGPVSMTQLMTKLNDNSQIKNAISSPWLILLCKFSNHPEEPQTPGFFENFFTKPGTGGLFDYWSETTFGFVNLNQSVVKGWFTLPYTLEEDQKRDRAARIISDCKRIQTSK